MEQSKRNRSRFSIEKDNSDLCCQLLGLVRGKAYSIRWPLLIGCYLALTDCRWALIGRHHYSEFVLPRNCDCPHEIHRGRHMRNVLAGPVGTNFVYWSLSIHWKLRINTDGFSNLKVEIFVVDIRFPICMIGELILPTVNVKYILLKGEIFESLIRKMLPW